MAVDQLDRIDSIEIDEAKQEVVLGISNDMDWSDTYGHQIDLQLKLNHYRLLVDSGDLLTIFPKAKGMRVTIAIHCKYPIGKVGEKFYQDNHAILKHKGIELKAYVLQQIC